MIQLFLVPVLALMQGVAEPPCQAPDGWVGVKYEFQICISNPDNVEPLSFKRVAGEFPPGISFVETGLVQGVPLAPGAFTVTIAVLSNDIELARHDYNISISPSRVSFTDSNEPDAGLTEPASPSEKPTPTAVSKPTQQPAKAGSKSTTKQPTKDGSKSTTKQPAKTSQKPAVAGQMTIEPLTTASATIEGWSSGTGPVVIKRNGVAITEKAKNTDNHFSYAVPSDSPLLPGEKIQACPEADSADTACTPAVTVQQVKRLGEEARLVLGFQQAGAAGATDEQKFFFDFYISRPLPFGNNDGADPDSHVSWWGNVRVSSTPQQINSPLSAQAITSAAKGLKINQLAQSAEFLSGLDFRLGRFLCPLWSQSSNTKMRSALFLSVGAGATGPLTTAASSTYPVYTLDPADSDYPRLVQNYPQAGNTKYKYISFIPPARNQYDIEYFGGFKLVTHYADTHGTPGTGPPAIVSFTVGQNELVTGGALTGVVSRMEGFFPLSTGQSGLLSSIYLFGNAQLRLHSAQNLQPYNFAVATTGSTTSNTLYVATPSNRDVYSVGLGLDLVKVLSTLNITAKKGK